MSSILFGLLTVALILVSGYLILIILMQRASSNSGMGAALGGGAAESALGAGASNVLTKGTIYGSAAFFVLSFCLYLGFLATMKDEVKGPKLPVEISAPESAAAETDAKPLVKLPEDMQFTATAKLNEAAAATEDTATEVASTATETTEAAQESAAQAVESAPEKAPAEAAEAVSSETKAQ